MCSEGTETLESFTYLGKMVSGWSCQEAWKGMKSLYTVMGSLNVSIWHYCIFVRQISQSWSRLSSPSVTWTLSNDLEKRIKSLGTTCFSESWGIVNSSNTVLSSSNPKTLSFCNLVQKNIKIRAFTKFSSRFPLMVKFIIIFFMPSPTYSLAGC